MLCGFLGFIQSKENFTMFEKERNIIKANVEKIVHKMKLSDKKLNEVGKKVEQGKLQVVVLNPEEMQDNNRKARKSQTLINREVLYTLQEFAIFEKCVECNINRSKCRLRIALIKSNCPEINEKNKNKCQFYLERGFKE